MSTPERDVTLVAPYHRTLERPEPEFDASRYEGLEPGPGWRASAFSAVDVEGRRHPRTGVVNEPFGISWESSGGMLISDTYRLVHLPSGRTMAETQDLQTAVAVAAVVRDIPLGPEAFPSADDVALVLGQHGYERLYLVLEDILWVPIWKRVTLS